MARKKVDIEDLKNFVRREAGLYLKQKNVTSIGIGYREKDGQPTEEISIQFTVSQKVKPEALESIGATLLPKSVKVAGVDVPTDVVERKYKQSFREIQVEATKPRATNRKVAINPVVPGVSIGHPSISAGTAGCVVYDSASGKPYLLSAWHVLHGDEGSVGDDIVQPGAYDDNRTAQNRVGSLERSYLGIAGDCALATIEDRTLEAKILGLNLAVGRLGEPELGDKVVKSGRTTNVTYGQVNRIHVVLKLDYGGLTGEREIGCFEIGPDPDRPAESSQISQGGDSGSAWLAVSKKKPTDMMLGMHFAGETGDGPDHALAAYASSIFDKLQILPAPPKVLPAPSTKGYLPGFIGSQLALPLAGNSTIGNDLLKFSGKTVFDYTHFSLAMSQSRKFARWVAWNIDGKAIQKISRTGISFRKDPNLPATSQVGDELYSNNSLDKGHIARRADLVWGTPAEAAAANIDSFFFTNITPQHSKFNQSGAKGIWGMLEDAIFADIDVNDLKISVMGGPVLSDSDPVYRNIKIPRQFWKIIYYRETNQATVRAKAYLLSQGDLLNQLEALELPEFRVYEVSLTRITDLTGLKFPLGEVKSGKGPRPPKVGLELAKMPQGDFVRHVKSFDEIVGKNEKTIC
jgi:endonuclease G